MRAAIYARGGCRRWSAALRPPEYRLSVFTSLCVGIFAAIIVGALSFAADAVDAYIAPARLVVPIVGPLIPPSLVSRLIPDGGAPAGVMLILGSAILFVQHSTISSTSFRTAALANNTSSVQCS
jgi:hypothetical protein